jgi:DNA-binding NarL/FixJ family response regulator
VSIRLLIADDNATVRRLLRALLETHEGWQVCGEAENGMEAVAKAAELQPDVIILDLAMPMMDGLHAAREISRNSPGIPILIHTLHNVPGLDVEMKKAGVRKIINKTETADELLLAIEEGLREKSQSSTKASPSSEPVAAAAAATGGTSEPLQPNHLAAASGAGNGSSETPTGSDDAAAGAKPN